jgi:hypothetical protein
MHRIVSRPSAARRLLAVLAVVLCGAPAFAQRGEPIAQQLIDQILQGGTFTGATAGRP